MDKEIFVTKSSMPPYEEYIKAIKPLWESHWLTNMGKYHRTLEEELKEYLGVSGISLIVNGHMALELAIQSFDFPEFGEVITTPFTFISTTHAIVRNHLQPIFCDVKEDGTIDENKIEHLITPKTVAILPVHVYGNICNIEIIREIAKKYNLKVIYDASHAFGETYKGKGIGNYGDVSTFSFHATKVYNTIEGGAATFKDESIYEKLFNLKNFGIRDEETVTEVGANAKMNEFAAIMGLCNLRYIDDAIGKRKEVYYLYKDLLSSVDGLHFLMRNSDIKSNYGYLPIVCDENIFDRDELYNYLLEKGIHSRKYFYPLTADQACFKNKYRDVSLPIARRLSKRVLVLPLYENLREEEVRRIVLAIKEYKDSK